jgi:phosphinothricin acetyltransferase
MSESSPPLTIRAAREEDLVAISAIHNDVVASSNAIFSDIAETLEQRREWFAQRIAAGWPVLVAGAAGEVLGFASFGPFRTWPGYRETVEQTIHVHRDARRRGVGRALAGALVDEARERRLHAIIAGIDGGNEASIALHRAVGFAEVGLLPQVAIKHGTRLDLLLMELLLDPIGAVDPYSNQDHDQEDRE